MTTTKKKTVKKVNKKLSKKISLIEKDEKFSKENILEKRLLNTQEYLEISKKEILRLLNERETITADLYMSNEEIQKLLKELKPLIREKYDLETKLLMIPKWIRRIFN